MKRLYKDEGILLKEGEEISITTPTPDIFTKVLNILILSGIETTIGQRIWSRYEKDTLLFVNFKGNPKLMYGNEPEPPTPLIDGEKFIDINTYNLADDLGKLEKLIQEKENESTEVTKQ